MIRNVESIEEQQNVASIRETNTSHQNRVAIPAADDSVVRVSESSISDDWTSSDEDDDQKQVAEVSPQAPAENKVQVTNTYTDCTSVSSTVNNTNIYKEGVTVNNYFYCCPASIDYVVKWCRTRRRVIIITLLVLIILLTISLSAWLLYLQMSKSPKDTGTETAPIIPTTEEIPQSTTTIIPPISTDSTTSSITIPTSTDSSNNSTTEIPNHDWKIIRRKDWGALSPTSPPVILYILPPKYVIFSETQTETCSISEKCIEIVQDIQTTQMKDGLEDIAYNFLIGGDGMVYEGRGWDIFASGKDYDWDYFDDWSLSVSFVGKFDVDAPTEIVLQAAKRFLEFGSKNDKLDENPRVKCLRQLSCTKKNPGDKLYEIIETWEGWDNITISDSL